MTTSQWRVAVVMLTIAALIWLGDGDSTSTRGACTETGEGTDQEQRTPLRGEKVNVKSLPHPRHTYSISPQTRRLEEV